MIDEFIAFSGARPDPNFALPPYSVWSAPRPWRKGSPVAEPDEPWHCVVNASGYNCLQFASKPGAKFTTLAVATELARRWNAS